MKWALAGIVSVVLLTLSFSMITSCNSPSESEEKQWRLVWQDEFDGSSGKSPDSSKWGFDIGTNWGNNQLEFDTDRPENVSLDGNGNLAIIARKETYEGQDYTSARIVTRDLFERTYGRFEARIKLPTGRGIWPAFWLLGANIKDVSWPACGEIDIMEYLGQFPSTIYGSIHGPGYAGGAAITEEYNLESGRFDTDFYVFAVEWGPGYIDWFVNDRRYHRVAPRDASGEWAFDHSFFIILNVAVGGNWVGPPDANTAFPQTMLVDWVRVYEEF